MSVRRVFFAGVAAERRAVLAVGADSIVMVRGTAVADALMCGFVAFA